MAQKVFFLAQKVYGLAKKVITDYTIIQGFIHFTVKNTVKSNINIAISQIGNKGMLMFAISKSLP